MASDKRGRLQCNIEVKLVVFESRGLSALALQTGLMWIQSRSIVSALDPHRAKVDRKWIETGLGQSTYSRWIGSGSEVDYHWK